MAQHSSEVSDRPAARRLTGALADGTVFTVSGTKRERVYTGGMSALAVRVKLAASPTGSLTVALTPMLSDAGPNDATGTGAAE